MQSEEMASSPSRAMHFKQVPAAQGGTLCSDECTCPTQVFYLLSLWGILFLTYLFARVTLVVQAAAILSLVTLGVCAAAFVVR